MKNHQFFSNVKCEYFPCHKTANPESFNCLFCFCPLYMLRDECGGNYRYLESGVKDCSGCMLTHGNGAYEHVMSKISLVIEKSKL